jgi:hypothetical protein
MKNFLNISKTPTADLLIRELRPLSEKKEDWSSTPVVGHCRRKTMNYSG